MYSADLELAMLLYGPGWPQTHTGPPASASGVLGLQVCATLPSQILPLTAFTYSVHTLPCTQTLHNFCFANFITLPLKLFFRLLYERNNIRKEYTS